MKFICKSFALTLILASGVTFAQPIPSQLKPGDVIPEMVWKNRTIKKNVKIINLIAGRVILKPEGSSTEQFRLDEFQKLVQLTNTSLEKVRAEIEEKRRLQEAAAAATATAQLSPAAAVLRPFLLCRSPFAHSCRSPFAHSCRSPFAHSSCYTFAHSCPSPIPAATPTTTNFKPTPESGNPFGTPMQEPSLAQSPTVVPSPAPLSNPSPPADTPSPALVPTPVPASPFAPSIVSTSSTPIRPVQPVSLSEPQEMKILRESIHGRIEQLQGEYLTSLSRLKGEYQARGDSAAADYVDQSIASVEHQTQELSRLLNSGTTRPR